MAETDISARFRCKSLGSGGGWRSGGAVEGAGQGGEAGISRKIPGDSQRKACPKVASVQ
jgi:hypothetical protein